MPSALGERWAVLVRQLIDAGSIGALVRELAMQAQCVAFDYLRDRLSHGAPPQALQRRVREWGAGRSRTTCGPSLIARS